MEFTKEDGSKFYQVKKRFLRYFWRVEKDPQTFAPLIFYNFNRVVKYIFEQTQLKEK